MCVVVTLNRYLFPTSVHPVAVLPDSRFPREIVYNPDTLQVQGESTEYRTLTDAILPIGAVYPLYRTLDCFKYSSFLLRITYCKYWIRRGFLRRPVVPLKLLTPLLCTDHFPRVLVPPFTQTYAICSNTSVRRRQVFCECRWSQ